MEKTIMNFKRLLEESLPESIIEVDAPDRLNGNWWIDIRAGKRRLTLEYRPGSGFGVFHSKSGYGEGPVEVYRTPERAARRSRQLLANRSKYRRPSLKDLRELYDCSQVKMAEIVGVKQSAISRFEQRSEFKIGTLAAAVKALGGKLEVRAHFPDSDVPISVND
jgi:hypothetical protein